MGHPEVTESDFSNLEGTNCFCSGESADAIRQAISSLPLCSVHRIGTGDYHYISLFWLERISEPFVLFLFDNHPDDQEDAFGGGLLSCGNWVIEARKLHHCKASVWYDGKGARHEDGSADGCRKAYVSIDLDVLSEEYARTDWDQGEMTLECLTGLISEVFRDYEIIGMDICGGLTPAKGASPDDITLNALTEEALVNLFRY